MQLRELARLNGTLREDDNRWETWCRFLEQQVNKCCRCLILINVYFLIFFFLSLSESYAHGRALSLAASQTQLSVQSVVEQVTSHQTASLPGNPSHQWSAVISFPLPSSLPPSGYCQIKFRKHSKVNCISLLLSSFAQRPGEPPQSAQDKARMDKEYLSLMAELGEAPVPGSSGGHSNPPPSGPRPAGPNNNHPPQVSPNTSIFPYWRPISL